MSNMRRLSQAEITTERRRFQDKGWPINDEMSTFFQKGLENNDSLRRFNDGDYYRWPKTTK